MKQIVSYGGGTNSTAMLIEMVRRNEQCDAVVFADTGGERPETYTHVAEFSDWLKARGYPGITTVQNDGIYKTLENECMTMRRLPAAAFGFGACSDKYKQRPFRKWFKSSGYGKDATVLIGFDADEPRRAERSAKHNDIYKIRYPLIEWDMGRDECIEVINMAGMSQPEKSSCFFCPNMTKKEILKLRREHPDLLLRALEIEKNAETDLNLGLGRSWSWSEFIKNYEAQGDLFCGYPDRMVDMPCGCYDG